jgi:hypothetical protein
MSDGRHFTDYRPSCEINDLIKFDNNVSNSLSYRQFLTHNGEELMARNREAACLMNCCGPCPKSFDADGNVAIDGGSTMLPEQSMWVSDGRVMKRVLTNPNGLGTGRQYWTEDKGAVQSRMMKGLLTYVGAAGQ